MMVETEGRLSDGDFRVLKTVKMWATGSLHALPIVLGALLVSCAQNAAPPLSSASPSNLSFELTALEVQGIIRRAASSVDAPMVVAVTNRSGMILGLFEKPGSPATSPGNFGATVDTQELSVALARTAAFFSNDQAPLSSRTVRFISQVHFPPGISFTPSGPLYGIENTNRGCTLSANFNPGQEVPPARAIGGSAAGLGMITGKPDLVDSDTNAVNPGGVPIFRDNHLVGGVGVAGAPPDVAELAAYSGAVGGGFGPTPAPPGVVVIDGVSLPFVNNTSMPAGATSGSSAGTFLMGPVDSPGPVPDGYLVGPLPGPVGGLRQDEVQQIVTNSVNTASTTRAVVRLPIGSRARMAIAVADLNGTLIALYRMSDATVFSIDVAASKARNMVYFNGQSRMPMDLPGIPLGVAVTNRTIGFGAQPFFPSGMDGGGQGPFFSVYTHDTAQPCSQGLQPSGPNQSGIVFFPGSVPLYKNGVLVGGLGVSGDGVDQDDFVANGGWAGFEAPPDIRADNLSINGIRLPFLKFPRNPTD